HRFKYELIKQSVKNKKTVVLPESNDERILKAAEILLKSKVVDLILLGDEEKIKQDAARLSLDLSTIQIMNPLNSEYNQEFTSILYEARKSKGMSLEEAKMLVQDKTYFGTLLIHTGKADAMVSGASTTTAETIRPALQLIKTKEGISSVSGIFFMGLEDQVLAFADCAVNP
ncbi:phosphate acetyltransferase, partial [Campylobacter sp. CH185]